MTSAILIDSNIPMYAGGSAHPLKQPCIRVLRLAASHRAAFITDAEVLQELMHRYLSQRIWAHGRAVFHRFAGLMEGRIEPVHAQDVQHASRLADEHSGLSARDLVHAAVMNHLGVSRIVSADSGFDRIEGIERLDPARVEEWERDGFA